MNWRVLVCGGGGVVLVFAPCEPAATAACHDCVAAAARAVTLLPLLPHTTRDPEMTTSAAASS
jgi:hypothetical protein